MTEQEKNLIIALWENGTPVNSIVRMLDCKEYHARQYIKELRNNGTLTKENRRKNATEIVVNVFNKGETNPYKIAEITGYKVSTVRTLLNGAHITIPKGKRNRPPTKISSLCELTQLIIEDIKSGEKFSQIAKNHNVSRQYVYKIKDKYVKEKSNG